MEAFLPSVASASFISSIFNNSALAQDVNNSNGAPLDQDHNSQTLDLLQSNVSSASILQDKTDKKKDDKKDNTKDAYVDPKSDVSIVSDSAIQPATSPLATVSDKDIADSDQETSVYVVRKGDSIAAIADMFGVSVNTILAANDLKKGEKLKEGDVLFILPVSGVEHTVTKGQTLQSIAKLYKVDVSDIAFYNGITPNTKLAVGDKIVVPGGEMNDEGGDKPASNLGSAVARDKNYYASHPLQNLLGYFINPVPTGHKTQGLHGPGHRGIDIGAPIGTPIYASAPGVVLIAKTGWSGGYGNMVILQHPNGTKTLYGHMVRLGTHTGDKVERGEIIGYVGSTGHSTGPHLHFEVFNAKNPGADWSWAN